MYLLYSNNYPEDVRFEIDNLYEVMLHLKDLFKLTFSEIVDENDKRLEDPFLFCTKVRFNSIDRMTIEQLQDEFLKEFNWTLTKIN